MAIKVNSQKTTLYLAPIYGVCNTLDQFIEGQDAATLLANFLTSMVIGTLATMALAWIVLAILRRGHLLYAVTNWVLLIGSVLSLILSFVIFKGTL